MHALPTLQPGLPMQGGGLVHLHARGARSGLLRSQYSFGGLCPRRGSSPNIDFRSSNGVFESSIAQKIFIGVCG
ncbi:hypothetical protein L211DRAFT_844006, partial [Terfezia boudieri ATCC MYA-4762]